MSELDSLLKQESAARYQQAVEIETESRRRFDSLITQQKRESGEL
jgi:hypothetical protein